MVTKLFRPGSNGVSDWIIQRLTGVVLALYFIFLLGIFFFSGKISFEMWRQLFAHPFVQIFSLFALISLLLHAWVGIWTILTDYVSCSCLRFTLHVTLIGILFFYLIWGIKILWG
jgi:succinate dehydrogenase / fumarate reductase, membrane anchor subunit